MARKFNNSNIKSSGRSKSRRGLSRRSKKSKGKSYIMNYRSGGNINSPLPPLYRTKFHIAADYYTGSGAGSGVWYIPIFMNQLVHPLAPAATGVTILGLNTVTANPTGLTQLLNTNTYLNYRVLAVKAKVDPMPDSSTDATLVCLSASNNVNQPPNVWAGQDAPWTVSGVFGAGRSSQKSLSLYVPLHKFFGLSKMAIRDDLSGRFSGTATVTPTNLGYINIYGNDMINQIYTNPVAVRVRLTYYVELYGLVNQTMVET